MALPDDVCKNEALETKNPIALTSNCICAALQLLMPADEIHSRMQAILRSLRPQGFQPRKQLDSCYQNR